MITLICIYFLLAEEYHMRNAIMLTMYYKVASVFEGFDGTCVISHMTTCVCSAFQL